MLLLTAFEPFDETGVNSSQEVLAQFMATQAGGLPVASTVLPVRYEADVDVAWHAAAEVRPSIILHLGQSGRAEISVERIAVNLKTVREDGSILHRPVLNDAPPAYLATVPVEELLGALQGTGVPAHSSAHAGTYMCNHILFRSLHRIASGRLSIAAGFLHLPRLPEQAERLAGNPPSLSLHTMVAGLRAIVSSLLQA